MHGNMFLNKVLDWVFSVSGSDTPYKWRFDALPKRDRFQPSLVGSCSIEEKEIFKKRADEAMKESLEVIASDGWEVEKECCGGTIYSKRLPKYGKTYKYEGIVDMPPQKLNSTLFYNFEHSPSWNRTIVEAKILQRIDENTNIARFVVNSLPPVSSRDFINLRSWRKNGDAFVNFSFSVNYPHAPETTQFVRGEQGFCTYVMQPVAGDPNKSKLIWLMQAHLKGWLPQYVIDRTMGIGINDHISCIKSLVNKRCTPDP